MYNRCVHLMLFIVLEELTHAIYDSKGVPTDWGYIIQTVLHSAFMNTVACCLRTSIADIINTMTMKSVLRIWKALWIELLSSSVLIVRLRGRLRNRKFAMNYDCATAFRKLSQSNVKFHAQLFACACRASAQLQPRLTVVGMRNTKRRNVPRRIWSYKTTDLCRDLACAPSTHSSWA